MASRPRAKTTHRFEALETDAALLGWLLLSLIGAAGLGASAAGGSYASAGIWIAVLAAGVVASAVLVVRRRRAAAVRRLLSYAQQNYPHDSSDDSRQSSTKTEDYLSDLLARIASFVGAPTASVYVVPPGSPRPVQRCSVGGDLSSAAVRIAVTVASSERGTASVPDDVVRARNVLAAPLFTADVVTGVLVVSAPKRLFSKARSLSRLVQVAQSAGPVIERARLGEAEWRSRLGAAHASSHLAILGEAALCLSVEADSTEESFARLGTVIVPDFADWFAVHMEDSPGDLTSVTTGSDTGAFEGLGLSFDDRGSGGDRIIRPHRHDPFRHIHPDGEALVRSAMATGGAVVSADLAAGCTEPSRRPGTEPALSLVQASPTEAIGSLMVVPVEVHGRPVGALSFVTFPGRRGFRPSDLETAATLAGTVSAAAERMLLLRQGQILTLSSDRRADRLRRLVETALVVSTPLSEREVLQLLVEHAKRVIGCGRVVVAHRQIGLSVEVSSPPGPDDTEMRAVRDAIDRVLGGSRSSQESSSLGVASFRINDAGTNPSVDWVAAPVDHSTGHSRRAMVAIGSGEEPFGPDDEAALALLARMASAALERAALYETLRSNEQRLTALVEASPLAIAELDLDGTVRWWNKAAGNLFGWEDSIPAPRTIPVTGDAASALGSYWERARLGVATVGALVAARRPDGEIMELSLSVAPLEENDGSTGGILAVVEDATEREQVVEQFHRSQRLGAMARLAGGIAHDFSNLVTVILASSETLIRLVDETDPIRPEVEAMHRVGKRAAALTSQLMQIGQRTNVSLVETDPSDVIAQMTDELREVLGRHVHLEVTKDRFDTPPWILVDRAELERAILNLAFNARDAMPQGGQLVIDTRLSSDAGGRRPWVVISVTDTGIGMDPSTAEHCFEPFFTTKGSASGTGLGLATVHAMVTQANGGVDVESTPGKGARFTLKFPLAGKSQGQRRETSENNQAPEVSGLPADGSPAERKAQASKR